MIDYYSQFFNSLSKQIFKSFYAVAVDNLRDYPSSEECVTHFKEGIDLNSPWTAALVNGKFHSRTAAHPGCQRDCFASFIDFPSLLSHTVYSALSCFSDEGYCYGLSRCPSVPLPTAIKN